MVPRYANMKNRAQKGVYPGSGVQQGGQVGRKSSIHMGSTNTQRGGVNAAGSARRMSGRPGTYKPPTFKPAKATGAVKPLRHLPNRFKPGQGPKPAKPVKPAIPAAPLPGPPVFGGLSTHDAAFGLQAAGANYDYDMAGLDIGALQAQIEANKPQYQLGLTDLNQWRQRDFEQQNADLAARGAFQSGGRIVADTDRQQQYDKSGLDLSTQYGDIAAKGIQGQVNTIEAQRLQARQLAMQVAQQEALDRALAAYAENPPGAPLKAGSAGGVTKPKAPGRPGKGSTTNRPGSHAAYRPAGTLANKHKTPVKGKPAARKWK